MKCTNPRCKNEFVVMPTHPHKKYCSRLCQKNAWQYRVFQEDREFLMMGKNYHCPSCDEDFVPHSRTQKCCSEKCSKKYYRDRVVAAKKRKVALCNQCGASYNPNGTNRKYCTDKCRNRHQTTKARKKGRIISDKEIARRKAYKKTQQYKDKEKARRENNLYHEQIKALKSYHEARINLKDRYLKALIREQNGVKSDAITNEMVEQKKLQIQITRQIYEKQRTIRSSGNHDVTI